MDIHITKYRYFIILLVTFSIFSFSLDEQTLNQYLTWGKFYFNLKKYDKAIPYYEKVLSMDPYNRIALDYLAMISEKNGYMPKDMSETPPPVKQKTGEAYQWYLNGKIQYEKGFYDKAAEAFINAYAKAPDEDAYRMWTYKSKRKFEYEEYQKRLADKKSKIDLKKVISNLEKNKPEKSVETSRQWYLRAKFSFTGGDCEKAIDELKLAFLYNPENQEALQLQKELETTLEKKKDDLEPETPPKVEVRPEPRIEIEKAVISEAGKQETGNQTLDNRRQTTDAEKTPKKDIFPIKRDLKYINTTDRITLAENITLDNHIVAGMFELTDKEKRLSTEVETLFNDARTLFEEKKFALMSEKLEEAYLKVHQAKPDDFRALYYLYIINERKKDIKNMKQYLFKMTKALNKTYYHNGKWYDKCKELADCLFYQLIIQSAYTAYTLRDDNNAEFRLSSLKHEGYLSIPEHKTIIIDFMGEKFTWRFSHIHHDDHYYLEGKSINCRLHGQNPILTEEYSVIEE